MMPVIFIHYGYNDYFEYACDIALKKNKVIHIGDKQLNILNSNYNFININEYEFFCDEFLKYYKHYHKGPVGFEQNCFLRWIVLNNYVQKNKIHTFFYADSDVAVVCDVNEEYLNLNSPKISYVIPHESVQYEYRWSACGLSSYWQFTELDKLVKFMHNCYIDDMYHQKLKDKWNWHINKNIGGGICDMTIFYFYMLCHEVQPINKICNFKVFDHNINVSENYYNNEFKMKENKKYLEYDGNNFYSITNNNEKIKMNSIHCQGYTKDFMKTIKNIYSDNIEFNNI
jgi:hypothetical protein